MPGAPLAEYVPSAQEAAEAAAEDRVINIATLVPVAGEESAAELVAQAAAASDGARQALALRQPDTTMGTGEGGGEHEAAPDSKKLRAKA